MLNNITASKMTPSLFIWCPTGVDTSEIHRTFGLPDSITQLVTDAILPAKWWVTQRKRMGEIGDGVIAIGQVQNALGLTSFVPVEFLNHQTICEQYLFAPHMNSPLSTALIEGDLHRNPEKSNAIKRSINLAISKSCKDRPLNIPGEKETHWRVICTFGELFTLLSPHGEDGTEAALYLRSMRGVLELHEKDELLFSDLMDANTNADITRIEEQVHNGERLSNE